MSKKLSTIVGSSVQGVIPVPVFSGGTGLTSPGTSGNVLTSDGLTWVTAPAPISLPTQTGNTGKFLTTNGTSASWMASPAKLPVLKRDGSTSNVTFLSGYLAIVNRSGATIQVSIT